MCPVEDKDKDTFESKFCSNIFGLLEHLVAIFLQCGKMLEFSARHANLRKKVLQSLVCTELVGRQNQVVIFEYKNASYRCQTEQSVSPLAPHSIRTGFSLSCQGPPRK